MNVSRSLSPPALPPPGSRCVALGLFDGLHLGHMAVIDKTIEQAGALCLVPLVFTFTPARGAPESKGGCLLSFDMMSTLLESRGVREIACPDFDDFRDLSPRQFVRDVLCLRLGAGRVVCGYDFRFGKNAAGDVDALRSLCAESGIGVDVVPAVLADGAPAASRRIRALVESGDMPCAARLLGRPFTIDFPVVHGRGLGRGMGLPTINQPFPPSFVLPRLGVYATRTQLGGGTYSSVTNVGVKPTVGSDTVLAETYIQGFSGDLYGECVQVRFFAFLRPERAFPDLSALQKAIRADAQQASKIVMNMDSQ